MNFPFEPYNEGEFYRNPEDEQLGQKLIAEGKVGCLVLAGGQGSRLQYHRPKGCYPISVVKQKSLFQLCAERVLAAGYRASRQLLLAVMTAPETHQEIKQFFHSNRYFGLDEDQVFFFEQSTLPFLDENYVPIKDKQGNTIEAPDGNGGALEHFWKSGIGNQWQKLGVKLLNVIPIENALADPFDASLIGFHARKQAEITLKCTEKRSADEKVGVLVRCNGRCKVIEYSELEDRVKEVQENKGVLKYRCANLGLFVFSMDFIYRVVEKESSLPIHYAWKSLPPNADVNVLMGWKQERFIFDLIPLADRVAVLMYSRNLCFAPLKNASGLDSPETVKEVLQKYDLYVLEKILGTSIQEHALQLPLELSPEFYYPTERAIKALKRRGALTGYIQPD